MNIKETLEHIKQLLQPKENKYIVTIELKNEQIKKEITDLNKMKKLLQEYPDYTSVYAEQKTKTKKYYPKNKCWSDINK